MLQTSLVKASGNVFAGKSPALGRGMDFSYSDFCDSVNLQDAADLSATPQRSVAFVGL